MNTIENTLFIGKELYEYPRLDSTNRFAVEYLSKNNPSEGTVISTYNQVSGRGQIGSKWESEAFKNITLSIIVYPTFLAAQHQFWLNQVVSLGVFDCITKYINKSVKVKWPNDIYVQDNKIAGILIQNTLSGRTIQSSIMGVGININQKTFISDAPNPTSFLLETGKEYPLDAVRADLCGCVERRYLQLRTQQHTIIRQDYLNNLYRFMEPSLFQRADGTVFNGKIIGITQNGKLRIEHNTGEEAFGLKEVGFV